VEVATEDPVRGGVQGDAEMEEPWKVRDLLADERCSQAVLDFLASTDVGRRVTAEEGAVSEVSEAELREWLREQVPGSGG